MTSTRAAAVGTWTLLVAACGGGSQPPAPSVAVRVAAGDCLSPVSFGAVVDDGRDDREAIQRTFDAACASGKPVCLPAGELHVARRYGTGADHAWSLALTCDGVDVSGQGDASRVMMLGSAR